MRICVSREPENLEARRELLDLLVRIGKTSEPMMHADHILRQAPDDPQAVMAKAHTLTRTSRYEEALAFLRERVPPSSPRIAEHLLQARILNLLGEPADKIRGFAESVREAHPTNDKFALVEAAAHQLTGDPVAAKEKLLPLVPVAQRDAAFATLCLPNFDSAGLHHDALTILRGLDAESFDHELMREIMRRLWEARAHEEIVDRSAKWDLDRCPTPVLAHRTLALRRLEQDESSNLTLEALRLRQGDAARAWVRLIDGTVMPAAPSVHARIEACLSAIELDAENAHFYLELGRAYRDGGEVELATRAFRDATVRSRSWATPAAEAARMLASKGQMGSALAAAKAALTRSSDDGKRRDSGGGIRGTH